MNWLQTVAQISVGHMVNLLPEGVLVAMFAWGLLRVMRRQNSGTRFAVWFLALLAVAALPLLAVFGEGRGLAPPGISSATRSAAFTVSSGWAVFFFSAWAFGVLVSMMRLAAGLWQLRRLRRSCTPIVLEELDPAVRRMLDASSAGVFSSIAIATSESVRVPAAIGFWKRTIILPAWTLLELPASDLNVILLHELAHLRRWDDWTNLIQKLVRALFFFHPAVWWIEKHLSVEREMACDDAVLAQTANPQGYAACLVSLLEKSLAHRASSRTGNRPSDQNWSMAQAAVNRAREATLRLAQILDKNRPAAIRVWKPAVGMVSAFSVACLMALPLAPQFVAFDHRAGTETSASNSDHSPAFASEYSTASIDSSTQSAMPVVIPAALHVRESSSERAPARIIRARIAAHKPAPVNLVAAQADPQGDVPDLVQTSQELEQGNQPRVQTLVFIEATQFGNSETPAWSFEVWRVTFISGVRERMARVPVTKSI